MYDLDCFDNQHSHGKSIGKYHMVNRVKDPVLGIWGKKIYWMSSGISVDMEFFVFRYVEIEC